LERDWGRLVNMRVRDAFIAQEGCVLLSADYSQIEVRMMAHFSNDRSLCAILNKAGDVFRGIGALWQGCAEADVNDEQRQQAKGLCYGILYGQGARGIAAKLGVPACDGFKMVNGFYQTFSGLKPFMKELIREVEDQGYVETLLGRRRYLPAINFDDAAKRAQAARQAVNSLCQASAADLIKLAMINIHRRLMEGPRTRVHASSNSGAQSSAKSAEFVSPAGQPLEPLAPRVRLVLQIHDELVYEVPVEELDEVTRIVRECMESTVRLRVPVLVNVKSGPRWGCLA
jgi:DNA polymerase theta